MHNRGGTFLGQGMQAKPRKFCTFRRGSSLAAHKKTRCFRVRARLSLATKFTSHNGPIYGPEGSLLERVRSFQVSGNSGGDFGNNSSDNDGEKHGIACHELPHMVREINPFKDHFCFHDDLKGLIKKIEPDIVHTHSSKAGVLGRWAAWQLRKRQYRRAGRPLGVVHTIHGPPFHDSLGTCTNAAYTLAERFAAKRCHMIVSVADAMTGQFLARGIGQPNQYITVRSGMEVDRFLEPAPGEDRVAMRTQLGIGPEDFVIGTVARLAEHKGHDDVIDALAGDLRAHAHWKLLWVGDGWWRDRLMQRLDNEKIRTQVITPGLVPQERVPAMMRAMDLLVHPSYREGLPRTIPQALLTETPVVAYDTDGTREACIDPDFLSWAFSASRRTGFAGYIIDDERAARAIRHGPSRCTRGSSGLGAIRAMDA